MSLRERTKNRLVRVNPSELALTDLVSMPALLLAPITLLLLAMFVGPMLILVFYSVQTGNALSLDPSMWTLSHYTEFFDGITSTSGLYRTVVRETVVVSLATVALTFLISYPAAYAMAHKIKRFHTTFLVLLIIPLFTGITLRVFGWNLFLGSEGVLTGILGPLGIQLQGGLLYTTPTIILGTTYVYLPFMLFPVYLSMLSMPASVFPAATDLGAGRLRIFRKIVIPLSRPGVIIGALFVFVLTLGSQVESRLLGGGQTFTLASNIQYSFNAAQNWPLGSVQAVIMMVIATIGGVYILRQVDLSEIAARSSREAGTVEPATSRLEQGAWNGYMLLVIVFMMIPILSLIVASVYAGRVFALPFEFTLDWYGRALASGTVRGAMSVTLQIALAVTVLSTIVGTMGALGYARYDFRGKELLKVFVLLPIFFPQLLIGLGMSIWSNTIGLGVGIVPTIIAQTTWISPIVMFVVLITALGVNPEIEAAGRDLGASTGRLYRKVILPLISDGVIAGAIFAFVLSWNNYYIASYMSGVNNVVTTWVHSRLTQGFSSLVPGAAALVFYVSLVFVLVAFLFELRHSRRDASE